MQTIDLSAARRARGLFEMEPGTLVDAPKPRGLKSVRGRWIRGEVLGPVPVGHGVFVKFPKGLIPFHEVMIWDAADLRVVQARGEA